MKKILHGLVYFFLLYPILSFLSYEYTDTLINSIAFLLLLVTISLFFGIKLVTKSRLKIPTYLKFYILFFTYHTFADYVSGNILSTGVVRYVYTNYYLSMLFMMIIIENYSFGSKIIKILTAGIKLTIILGAVVSIIQIEMHDFFTLESIATRYDEADLMYRCTAIFSYIGSGVIGIVVPAFLAILFSLSTLENQKNLFYYVLCAIIILLYKSRWVMISFMIAISQNIKFDKKFIINSFRYLILAVIMIVITISSSIILDLDTERYVTERLMSRSTEARVRSLQVFLIHFPKHALLGSGNTMSNDVVRDLGGASKIIHVGFLALFYSYGIIGGGIYCLYMYFLLKKLKKESAISGFKAHYFVFIMFVISNITLVIFHTFNYSIIISFIFHNYYRDKAIAQQKRKQQLELQTA